METVLGTLGCSWDATEIVELEHLPHEETLWKLVLVSLEQRCVQKQQPYNARRTEPASSLRCTMGEQETMFVTQTGEMQTGHKENL